MNTLYCGEVQTEETKRQICCEPNQLCWIQKRFWSVDDFNGHKCDWKAGLLQLNQECISIVKLHPILAMPYDLTIGLIFVVTISDAIVGIAVDTGGRGPGPCTPQQDHEAGWCGSLWPRLLPDPGEWTVELSWRRITRNKEEFIWCNIDKPRSQSKT